MEPPKKLFKLRQDGPSTSTFALASQSLEEEITEKDLPLLANVEDVRVHHYLMKLKTNFSNKVVSASSILFLNWLKSPKDLPSPPVIILDTCYINIRRVLLLKSAAQYKVPEIFYQFDEFGCRKNFYKSGEEDWFAKPDASSERLKFTFDKWSTTISGWTGDLPVVIRIDFETVPNTPSLNWRPCRGFTYDPTCLKNVSAYTPVSSVNNRGLFPCQEPPTAMATWEVLMEVENGLTPLLSSDEPGELIEKKEGSDLFYFYTSIPLPMSTFAVAIGHFAKEFVIEPPRHMANTDGKIKDNDSTRKKCDNHELYPCRYSLVKEQEQKLLPVRLFSLDNLSLDCIDLARFAEVVHVALKTSHDKFGTHPFSRLDVVIMPYCFPYMGLASPSMIFLSSSNFTGGKLGVHDEPLFICRIQHEIMHSWFGLSIGPLDWKEEWLSEGFATFCEDITFYDTFEAYFPFKSKEWIAHELVLKKCLRFITLREEAEQRDLKHLSILSGGPSSSSQVVKNGLEPIKQFMQIHYYKGYLLLWQMAAMVGLDNFTSFLKEYIWTHHGQLVTSDIFLQFYYDRFQSVLDENQDFISLDWFKRYWLREDELPESYRQLDLLSRDLNVKEFPLFAKAEQCLGLVHQILTQLCEHLQLLPSTFENLSSTQVIILLELFRNNFMLHNAYLKLSQFIDLKKQNPEIIHRWCELIIVYKDVSKIKIIEEFLERHMAMGVYLYGELMISEVPDFQVLAKRLYAKLDELYDLNTRRLLKEIVLGKKE